MDACFVPLKLSVNQVVMKRALRSLPFFLDLNFVIQAVDSGLMRVTLQLRSSLIGRRAYFNSL